MCHFTFILLHDGIISYIYNKRACRMSRLRLKLFPTFNLVLVLFCFPCLSPVSINLSYFLSASHSFTSELHLFSGNYYFAVMSMALHLKFCSTNGKWQIWCVNFHVEGWNGLTEIMMNKKIVSEYVSLFFFDLGAMKIIKAQKGGFEMMSIHWNKFYICVKFFFFFCIFVIFIMLMCCFFPLYK